MHASEDESGLFRLSRELRDDIYGRVLVISPPSLHVFSDGGGRIEVFAPGKPAQWPALLHTSRQLHAEASATLYGSHKFVLVEATSSQETLLQVFLNRIGPVNAGYLTQICVSFPAADPEGASLREDGLQQLQLLQERCSRLRTLQLFIHNYNSKGLVASRHDASKSEISKQFLSKVDAELKGIASLRTVFVKLYHGPLAPEISELMRGFGWVVEVGR